ncbi:unnamed protein product [Callosobruchus maculatus]|uniref:Peptidase S1 domain-containing protein n=1 Tax=Callosobruchus maculatus TaxID=64391 RepID=A0A653C025_CALMS|nr:unnamed protein product [Callosobruchus maculatus]
MNYIYFITLTFSILQSTRCQNLSECHTKDLAKSLVIITPKFPAVFCTGTLLNSKYALTAAHCILKTTMYVYAGLGENSAEEAKLVKSEVEGYHIHSRYERGKMLNDIAILVLSSHIEESDLIQYVHFRISSAHAYEWSSCKEDAFVMGLLQVNESSTSGTIYCSTATVYSGDECKQFFTKGNFERDFCVTLDHRDLACVGDSGGPVFCGDSQVGLISWGGCVSAMLCKVWGMPTRDSKFVGLGIGKRLLGGVDKRLCAGGGCARVDPDSPKTMSGFPAAVVNVDKKINFLRHYAGDIRADSAAPESLYRRFSGRVITCNLLFLVFTMFIKFSDL